MELNEMSTRELNRLAEKSTPASYALIQNEFARRAIVETVYDASQDTYVNPPEASNEWIGEYQIPVDPNEQNFCDGCE